MVLKRLTTLALALVLLAGIFAPAGASAHTRGIIEFEREVFATVTDRLTGRAGPGTEYMDLGTYNLTGQKVRAISCAYDSGNRCWIMIELPEHSGRRFMYVNSSRLKGYSCDRLFSESELALYTEETVTVSCPVLCSPYDNSGAYEGIALNVGDTVKVIASMGEYKLIEIASGEQKLRGWVPMSAFGQSSRERIDPSNANLVVTRQFEVYDESIKEGYPGRINEKGEWIQRCGEGEMGQFINGIAYAQRGGYDGNYGYIDENGDELLPFQWKNATDFIDGLAWVQNDEGKYGCINLQGETVFPFEWDEAFSCGDGLSWVRKGTTVGCLNKNGDLRFQLNTEYDELSMHATKLWNGYAMFYTEDVIYCVNANGDEVFQVPSLGYSVYDCGISSLYRELAAITVDGKQIFINDDMELVIPAELANSAWIIYCYYCGVGLALPDGSYVFSCPYEYQEGLCRVYSDGKFGYESLATGELVIPYEYTMTLPFNNGLAMVCRDGDETRTCYSEDEN